MRRLVLVTLLAAVASTRSATAQVDDHLKCYQVKNTTKFLGAVDLATVFGVEANCKITIQPKFYCVPATKTVTNTGGSPTANVVGPPLTTGFVCYKVVCPPPVPPDQHVTDQFGPHALAKLKPRILCAPAPFPTTTTVTITTTTVTTTSTIPAGCGTCGIYDLEWGSDCQIASGGGCVDPDGGGPLQLGDGQVDTPLGVAADGIGNVYVAEWGNARVSKFTNTGAFVLKWGTFGTGAGQFQAPKGIAVDGVGGVYVADSPLDRMQKFDTNGNFVTMWGTSGSGNGQFSVPWGVAANASYVYVADRGNQRIQRFNLNGTFQLAWGTLGSGPGQFNLPNAVAVDPNGNVYVADSSNNRIQKFDASGTFLTAWGTLGSGPGQFQTPVGVAAGPCGVYVSEDSGAIGVRVQRFDQNGNYLQMWGSNGTGPGQFFGMDLIGADPVTTSLYVPDYVFARIQRFDCN